MIRARHSKITQPSSLLLNKVPEIINLKNFPVFKKANFCWQTTSGY